MGQAGVKMQSIAWQEPFALEVRLAVTWEEVAARLWSPRTFSWAQLLLTVVSGQKRRRFLAQEVYGGKKRGQVSGHEKDVEVQPGWR